MREYKLLIYFKKWWVPFLLWCFAFILYNVGELAGIKFLKSFSFELLMTALLLLLVSAIFHGYKRKWVGTIISLFAIVGTFIFMILVSLVMMAVNVLDGDHWADNLKIPQNISLHTPIDMPEDGVRPDSIETMTKTTADFHLYNGSQHGLYYFDFWSSKIENGTIYLKAYEITQNYNLSKNWLSKTTAVPVFNEGYDIKRFGTTSHFTIYEGDWGKPYAARFEVWFKPKSSGKERKLFEKNYKIEGWMH